MNWSENGGVEIDYGYQAGVHGTVENYVGMLWGFCEFCSWVGGRNKMFYEGKIVKAPATE